MTLSHIDTIREDGLELRITQWQEKPRLEALIAAFLEEVQALEDGVWQIFASRFLDDAEGSQLEAIGRLVGQPRIGDDDEEFRLYIKARIAVNRSHGTADDVMRVADVLLAGTVWEYEELYPATIIVDSDKVDHSSAIATLLRLSRSGGVAFGFHFSEEPEGESFAFADGDEEQNDEERGFGGDDPDDGPGGVWIGAL